MPLEPDAELVETASGSASLEQELKVARAVVGTILRDGAPATTVGDALEVVRRLAQVERMHGPAIGFGAAAGEAARYAFTLSVPDEPSDLTTPDPVGAPEAAPAADPPRDPLDDDE